MENDLKQKLDQLLDDDDRRKTRASAQETARNQRQEAFVTEFLKVRKSTIEPAFRDFAAILQQRGWTIDIAFGDGSSDANGRERAAYIVATFHRGASVPRYGVPSTPEFRASCDKRGEKVFFTYSTISSNHGGSSGSDGSVPITDLTSRIVEDALARYIERLLNDSRPYNER